MNSFPLEHYTDRRDECLAAASASKLYNERQRHLNAAAAWQQILYKFEARLADERTSNT